MVGFPGTIAGDPSPGRPPGETTPRRCPICGVGLRGRQTSACSDKHRAAAWQASRKRELALALEQLGRAAGQLQRLQERS